MAAFLSGFQAREILVAARDGHALAESSVDLGMSHTRIKVDCRLVVLPDGQRLSLACLEEMLGEPACFIVKDGKASKLQFFLEETGRFYRLLATGPDTPPTAEISGIRMHRTKGTDPMRDTLSKIAPLRPIKGRVLDTCCGLGYTAIEALKAGAEEVCTVEADEGMRRLTEMNPWSAGLSDGRIRKISGDVAEVVKSFDDLSFSAIIHDPPMMALAGRLYSLEFYRQLYRVLEKGGRLFHYVGSPGARYRGKNPVAGAMKRLKEAEFSRIREEKGALGIICSK